MTLKPLLSRPYVHIIIHIDILFASQERWNEDIVGVR